MESGKIVIELITAGTHTKTLDNGDDLYSYVRLVSLLEGV
jgi:hypothetical protein